MKGVEKRRLGKYLKGLIDTRLPPSLSKRRKRLEELVELYNTVDDKDTVEARQVRQAFLFMLAAGPHLSDLENFVDFFIEAVHHDDFQEIQWGTPERYFYLIQFLYTLRAKLQADEVAQYIHKLIHHALRSFEEKQQYHKMIELLQLVSLPFEVNDQELLQLRSHAYVHEMHRVRRFRRLLYGYLLLQALFIVFIFPLLFINAENGLIEATIEEATDVELAEEQYQYFSYMDGLYWALITAASIGYGDITPVTTVGRVIAATLGIMGVITIGILAGLILDRLTPRDF